MALLTMTQEIFDWLRKMDGTVERRIVIRKRLQLACEVLMAAEDAAVELQLGRLAEQTIYQMRQIIEAGTKELRRKKMINQDQQQALDRLKELYHRYEF